MRRSFVREIGGRSRRRVISKRQFFPVDFKSLIEIIKELIELPQTKNKETPPKKETKTKHKEEFSPSVNPNYSPLFLPNLENKP